MKILLKEQITGIYDDTMSDFFESDDHKEAIWAFNERYFAFRKGLLPDEQQELDNLFRISDEINQSIAEEALYRGIIGGISEWNALYEDITK